MASMVVFLVVVWIADNLYWSAAIGMAFGVAQVGWLMFFTAALNVALALTLDTKTWSIVMSF